MSRRSDGSERLYRALLRLYPRAFRDEYEEELVEVFRYRRHQDDRRVGFWIRVGSDVITSAWREWRSPLEPREGRETMRGWMDDLSYAARRLVHSPGFSLTALVILVLGIGVNTTAFGFVNAVLFQPAPFVDAERVVLVLQDSDGGTPTSTSYPAYQDIARYDHVFQSVSAYQNDQVFVGPDTELRPAAIEYVTASYLAVTGLAPSRGRWFDESHDDPFGPPAAVLTHRYWTERFGADPGVVGQTIRVSGRTITVLGVGPADFNGGTGPVPIDFWLSISAMGPTGGGAAVLNARHAHPFLVRARLADGVSVEDATAAMNQLADELATAFPDLNANRRISVLTSLTPDLEEQAVPVAILAMSVVLLVLLVATLNLSNLLLVRTAARSRELAVRLALGSGQRRLVRVVVTEALLLAGLGGLGGVAMALAINDMLRNSWFDFGLPVSFDISLDGRVVLFAVAVTLTSGLLFGLIPAVRATSRGISSALQNDATTAIGSRRRVGLTGFLVAGQIAASLLLLAIAGVFVQSVGEAQGADPGFGWEGTGFVSLSLQPLDADQDEITSVFERLGDRLSGSPEVQSATYAARVPGRMFGTTTLLLGAEIGEVERPVEIPWNMVGVDYFDVLEVPVLAGRVFAPEDLDRANIAVISETMARSFFGRTDVVGRSYRAENAPDSPVEIIGVVGDLTVRSLGEDPRPAVYWLTPGASFGHVVFRARGETALAIQEIRRSIAEVDSRILITGSSTMEDQLGSTLQGQRLAGTILTGLGGLALLLAVLGIYGVVSFAVSGRRREVGIRLALGAKRDAVVRLFVRDVSAVVLGGGVVGVVASVPLSRVVANVFTGSPAGVEATTGAAALLVVTALVATAIPSLRAARTDPTEALRQD